MIVPDLFGRFGGYLCLGSLGPILDVRRMFLWGGLGVFPINLETYIYICYIYIYIYTWFVIVFVGQKCSTLPNVTLMMQSNVCWGFFSIDFSAFLKKLAQFGDTPPFMLFVLLVIDILDCLKKLGSGSYSPISTGNYWGFAIWDYQLQLRHVESYALMEETSLQLLALQRGLHPWTWSSLTSHAPLRPFCVKGVLNVEMECHNHRSWFGGSRDLLH